MDPLRSPAPDVQPPDETGRWLLWMTGAAALAVGAVALLLWGTRSGAYLLDLVAAFCA